MADINVEQKKGRGILPWILGLLLLGLLLWGLSKMMGRDDEEAAPMATDTVTTTTIPGDTATVVAPGP